VIARIGDIARERLLDDTSAAQIMASMVGWNGKPILIAGRKGAGKSSLGAWFVDRNFAYVSDQIAILADDGTVDGFPEPIRLPRSGLDHIGALTTLRETPTVPADETLLLQPDRTWLPVGAGARPGLIIFVEYGAKRSLEISAVQQNAAWLRLLELTATVAIPGDPAADRIADLVATTPCLELKYGSYEQLDGVLDFLARAIVAGDVERQELALFLSRFRVSPPLAPRRFPVQPPSPRRFSPKLTIGMATYDDYDGVYFSIQAIRLFHPEILDQVEFTVIDNHPDGAAGEPLKKLEDWIQNYRYLPYTEAQGTAVRDRLFAEAGGEFVLCMDSHVFIAPGALKRLFDYFDANPDSIDLLQGPLLSDDLKSISTHFAPGWRRGMYGTWAKEPVGLDPDAPPFDIPMQGLGLFACRGAAWPGFNPLFRGFGGEEGYIHEKFRQRGGRTLCLPFLRWVHRFSRPAGVPYRNKWEDRFRNYLIGFNELGLPTEELEAHTIEIMGEGPGKRTLAAVREELARLKLLWASDER
jgi:hypothetical protein